jgi:hypothetical protein
MTENTAPAAQSAPTFAEVAEMGLRLATRSYKLALDHFTTAAATNVSYAVNWNAADAVKAEARYDVWNAAATRGAEAATAALAQYLTANQRCTDPMGRAVTELQAEAARSVLRELRPYLDVETLLDYLT